MNNEPVLEKNDEKIVDCGKRLRIGMVGIGNIACIHLDAYKKVPEAQIVAACDIDPDRLERNCNKYGIAKRYSSIEEMIANEELDAVDVCVWNCNHAYCSIYALEHGLNVLCEKPMAYNTAEAIKMKEAADRSGKLLMIGFVLRFSTQTEQALDFRDDLGEIYYARAGYVRRHGAPGGWFCDKARSGGGPVIDLGVHVIDQIRYIMGCPKPVSVFATVCDKIGFRPELKNKPSWRPEANKFDNGVTDVEDFGSALIRFDNGATMLLETSYSLNGPVKNNKEIYGSKGGISLEGGTKFYTVMNNQMVDVTPVNDGISENPIFVNEMAHFVNCALNGEKCKCPAEDGIEVMRVLDAIYESARTGHEVVIER